jgi:hypothetical protein
MSLTLVGGLGAILGVFFGIYIPEGKTTQQVVWLSTMPSLFVGIGAEYSKRTRVYSINTVSQGTTSFSRLPSCSGVVRHS